MIHWAIYAMVYLGAALMIVNILGFIRFARYVKGRKTWGGRNGVLNLPILLLILFLAGYLAVGLFGEPDLIVAGILLGGSIFVFVIYRLLWRITMRIAESEHVEAELMAAEKSNRIKSSFLASVSHEMRTPMNVILGLDGMALKHPDLPPEVREQLEKIGLSARHLLALVNSTLDLRRIETGAMDIQEAPFALKSALDQVNAIIQEQAGEKGLTYRFSAESAAQGDYIGDATQLQRVLLSLLDNAVKYTDPPGTVRLTVGCAPGEGEADVLTFAVADTGEGIDPAFLPRVFDLFAQEDATFSNRHGGSGVGLTVAKRIMECMGGDIRAVSEKNVGSTFTVTVSLKRAPRAAASPEQGIESLAGRRILIVDDIDDNADIVADLLELEDAVSERAVNGSEAVDMIQRGGEGYYDAVLMDLRMPIMDGLEAARRIRALQRPDIKNLPIIALTANDFDSDRQNTLDVGMNAHLVKPVNADQLYAALKRWIPLGQGREDERP